MLCIFYCRIRNKYDISVSNPYNDPVLSTSYSEIKIRFKTYHGDVSQIEHRIYQILCNIHAVFESKSGKNDQIQ